MRGKGTDDNNESRLESEVPYKNVKFIKRHLLIALFFLVAATTLVIFNQCLLAGILVLSVVALGIIILKKNSALNEKYEALIAAIQKNDEKKDKIISSFSHKIREPLNNMVITENILANADSTSLQKEFIESINASVKSMIGVVNELTMEVAECMSFEIRKQIQFNIQSTIEHVIELYGTRNKENLEFEFIKTNAAYLECIGDPVIVKQIFIELFGRIEKQSVDRKTKIKVSLVIEKEEESEIVVAISVETNVKISMIDETDKVLAKLISMMKGKYSQKTDDISTANISLCIRKARQTKDGLASTKFTELISKENKRIEMKDLCVLLIEDNEINSKIVIFTLNPLVKSVDLAVNGKEALEMFVASNYDLVLMDIQLPIMDGLTAMKKIRTLESATNRHVPMIAITANAMISDKEKCLSAGADDYISKPFQPNKLIEKIKQLISLF